jgi:hypothetical protein
MPGSMGRGTVALVARALAAALLLWPWPQRAGAAEYVVGDVAFGWDSGVNYAAWAREHAFAVGDVLGQQPPADEHLLVARWIATLTLSFFSFSFFAISILL